MDVNISYVKYHIINCSRKWMQGGVGFLIVLSWFSTFGVKRNEKKMLCASIRDVYLPRRCELKKDLGLKEALHQLNQAFNQ